MGYRRIHGELADFGMLERAITAVFHAGSTQIRRATGHPAAPVTTEAMVTSVRARLAAVSALTAGQVTGEMLTQAATPTSSATPST